MVAFEYQPPTSGPKRDSRESGRVPRGRRERRRDATRERDSTRENGQKILVTAVTIAEKRGPTISVRQLTRDLLVPLTCRRASDIPPVVPFAVGRGRAVAIHESAKTTQKERKGDGDVYWRPGTNSSQSANRVRNYTKRRIHKKENKRHYKR